MKNDETSNQTKINIEKQDDLKSESGLSQLGKSRTSEEKENNLICNKQESLSIITTTSSSNNITCRICLEKKDDSMKESDFISPCLCNGTLKYVHRSCLEKWILTFLKTDKYKCEICKFSLNVQWKRKPFREWKPLKLSSFTKSKLLVSILLSTFIVAIFVWLFLLLIKDMLRDKSESDEFIWPFWSQFIVTFTLLGSFLLYMFPFFKIYYQLIMKLIRFNRILYIQNHPKPNRDPLPKKEQLSLPIASFHNSNDPTSTSHIEV